jgi:hypothetical protein
VNCADKTAGKSSWSQATKRDSVDLSGETRPRGAADRIDMRDFSAGPGLRLRGDTLSHPRVRHEPPGRLFTLSRTRTKEVDICGRFGGKGVLLLVFFASTAGFVALSGVPTSASNINCNEDLCMQVKSPSTSAGT